MVDKTFYSLYSEKSRRGYYITGMRPLEKLARHEGIAVDFDGTLIKNPGAHALWEFIREHHQTKKFWIVTFRTHQEREKFPEVWALHAQMSPRFPSLDMFHGVHFADDDACLRFSAYAKANPVTQIILYGECLEPRHPDEEEMMHFKAKKCLELGATALIDDLADMVEHGCRAHGVEFVDALNLIEHME